MIEKKKIQDPDFVMRLYTTLGSVAHKKRRRAVYRKRVSLSLSLAYKAESLCAGLTRISSARTSGTYEMMVNAPSRPTTTTTTFTMT